MNWRNRYRPSADATLVLASTALVLVLMLFTGLYLVWDRWQKYEAALEAIEPRVARLAGILVARDDIASTLDATRVRAAAYAYPHTLDPARVASELQSRVRDVFQGAGMSVQGSQQMPPRSAPDHQEIALVVNAQGGLPELEAALRTLRTLSPRLRIESITLQPSIIRTSARLRQPVGGRNPPQMLSVQIRLVANRLTSP
ncbi:type II secretion system protein GspM [Aromatoleum anaerobium]|uniref:General secretion pathway protein M n=1 Tax=Aromatoleum anaerobium TaxID=182180 RepID=A0ABX1PNH7_9RHOO|nr:type II secretion system protein GspM [Aromatoleum anaerobium]MCK0509358.1 type II secretion system protein GspM [Aromatoleum anaerobium]